MAKEERLQPISLHQEMQRSYLEYAMSVIVGRALPDARDGLKPVQRRILFAMHELGLTPERPYRKCARVVGDVLGKYHPHGDQAVYDALVRLVQTFSSRYPVLDGHGNFGSVDDDPAAAMRYTETRLAPIAHETLLNEIGANTVDFIQNFDGSQQEPNVLPAQLPFLLLNGCTGIAVGMATNIPPHNLNELVNGMIGLIKNPTISDQKLFEFIPGPDFPTGGEILIGSGIKETYLKGRGSIPMRGKTHVEEIHPGKGKHKRSAIVITELPYQLSKAGWIEKLADLVNEGKIGGIADIRDESDREGMRILVELRRDADSQKVLNDLHRKTALQNNFGAILLALVNGQPQQLSLRKLLEEFLEFRENTLIKRNLFHLKKAKDRLEVVEGLTKAINKLQEIILLIQEAADASIAKQKLINNLNINEKQADAVLAMPLRRLTGLEQKELKEEKSKLQEKCKALQDLLGNREELMAELIAELKELKKRFGNKRRTQLIEGGDEIIAEKVANQRPNAELLKKQAFEALPNEAKLLIQYDNQVKIVSPQVLGRLHLDEESKISKETTATRLILPINSNPRLLAVTKNGRVALIKWEFAGQNPGKLEKFLPGGLEGDDIINIIVLPNNNKLTLGLLSSDGRFKRLPLEEVLDLSGRASTILKLKEGVHLKNALICKNEGEIIILSSFGRLLRLKVNKDTLPVMGKLAQGPLTMRLFDNEKIINTIARDAEINCQFIVAQKQGKLTSLNVDDYRRCKRGDLGDIIPGFNKEEIETNPIIEMCEAKGLISYITNQGRNGRINSQSLNSITVNQPHQTILKLEENEFIENIIPLNLNIEN